MPTYDELKQELSEIATLLEKYPDGLKTSVYELLVAEYLGAPPPRDAQKHKSTPAASPSTKQDTPRPSRPPASESSGNAPSKRRSPAAVKPKLDTTLNLRGSPPAHPSFADFYKEKKPPKNAEFITVALYYLKHHLDIEPANLDQVFTCYREMRGVVKTPEAFRQAFIDTKNRTGYIEIDDGGTFRLSVRGENFVEHDLPAE